MTALSIYVIYADGKPFGLMFGTDEAHAEETFRQGRLGQKPIKELKAVLALDAPFEDFVRIALLAQFAAMTQAAMNMAQGRRTLPPHLPPPI